MADKKQEGSKQFWTPLGSAYWPKLVDPEVHEEYAPPPGTWRCDLLLPAEAPSTQKLMKFLDTWAAKGQALGQVKKGSTAHTGYEEKEDGMILFKFSQKVGYKKRTTGEMVVRKHGPNVVDVDNVGLPPDQCDIGHESKVKVLFYAWPFWKSRDNYGVTCKVVAVKVIEAVYGNGEPDYEGAEDFGDDENLAAAPGDFGDNDDEEVDDASDDF